MVRLGLRLALRSGREGLVRFVLTASPVAIGVAVLLVVLAYFHAYQATTDRPYWEDTRGTPVSQQSASATGELWNYSLDFFNGQLIERLDVAALEPGAPVVPGIARLPATGEYYASPALAALLNSVPADELRDRFPGAQAGIIGDQALSAPDELVIIVGYAPDALANLSGTIRVDAINTSPTVTGTTNIYRFIFVMAGIALLFPILILIGTATRLAAARREERFAALRLIGATPRQVNIIASVDAAGGALLGAVLGIGIFFLVQPAVAGIAITGDRFFARDVSPTIWGYLAALIIVPLASAGAALLSLRRVQISPLGVSRKVTPPPPGIWGVILLLAGIPLFIVPLFISNPPYLSALGLILVMSGLVAGGPWLTRQAANLLAQVVRGGSTLLAARRLADNPQTAFRAVSGLVLAVLLGTLIAVIAPTVAAAEQIPQYDALNNVLRAVFTGGPLSSAGGITPADGARLLSSLQTYPGVAVLPLYTNPAALENGFQPSLPPPPGSGGRGMQGPSGSGQIPMSIIGADSLKQFPVLGESAPGTVAVAVDPTYLFFNDNPLYLTRDLPLVTPDSPAYTGNLADLQLQAVLVRIDNPTTLERVRTLLATYMALSGSGHPPQTFGEVGRLRSALITRAERAMYAALALILVVAGCSLAVTEGGSLVERKRPFTLLRVSGTPAAALYKVVILEAVLPLVSAALIAGVTGFGLAVGVVKATAPAGTQIVLPTSAYYITMGISLAVSLAVVLITLPILNRLTEPDNARFE